MTTEEVTHVVQISSKIGTGCEHCDEAIGIDRFAESINHYIEMHGYRLLHVGTETVGDGNGGPWHISVAILGVAGEPLNQSARSQVQFIITDD